MLVIMFAFSGGQNALEVLLSYVVVCFTCCGHSFPVYLVPPSGAVTFYQILLHPWSIVYPALLVACFVLEMVDQVFAKPWIEGCGTNCFRAQWCSRF